MDAWLAWLLPVPVATLVAIACTAWVSRTRGPQEAMDSVATYERFRAAMDRPAPVRTPRVARAGGRPRDPRG